MFGSDFIFGRVRAIVPLLLGALLAAGPFTGNVFAASGTIVAAAPATGDAAARQARIHELLTLLAQQWLDEQGGAKAAASNVPESNASVVEHLSSGAAGIRDQIVALVQAGPRLPAEFRGAAERIAAIDWHYGPWRFFVFALVVGGAAWLFHKVTVRVRRHLDTLPMEVVADRLRVIAAYFGSRLGAIAGFAICSMGAFLLFEWPPIRGAAILGLIIAVVIIRLASALGDFVLAPGREDLRLIPMDTATALFCKRRVVAVASWFAVGWVVVQECLILGFSPAGLQLVGYTLGLGLVALALEAVWRYPVRVAETDASEIEKRQLASRAWQAGLSFGIVLLWVMWLAAPGVTKVHPAFWLVLVVMVLPLAIKLSRQAVSHLLRSPGLPETDAPPGVRRIALEHAIRALFIIGAVGILFWGWDVDFVHLAARDTFLAQVVRGVLTSVVVLLLADVFWHVLRAAIDSRLAATADLGPPNSEEARRRARLQTLLPVFRNVSLIVVVVVAVMTALAELGVQIGPLVASASVIGVAIGFGAQTFVRDIIAGMFYLLDDAFRVGEYIQSNNYKGTVEGFSIRSVRLRHHRGPVYTVPFSLLGAIQNQSRDWVIDKMMIGITYDSDLEKARKLIKQVGQELAQDPEFAPLIIEPLKMQGVEAFGEFAVQIRMKMMTLPGEQFVIRRKAYAMIKKAFDENGIKFALPTVQVASEVEPLQAAAARQSLELVHSAPD